MIPVKYVGARTHYTEGAYGSKINFTKGETVLVPKDLADKLLKHPDVYELGEETEAAKPAIIPIPNPSQEPEEDVQAARDLVANMNTVEALAEYAMTNFQQKLDKRQTIPTLRTKVTQFIDLYGVT